MNDIEIRPIDSCEIKVICDQAISRELQTHFTFEVPGYQYMPAFQSGIWDGRVRLYNSIKQTLSAGLIHRAIQFANDRNYTIAIDESLIPKEITEEQFDKIYDMFELPEEFTKEDHQVDLIRQALSLRQCLLLSPTGSGKSLIIYGLIKSIMLKDPSARGLIVVPTINLVSQFEKELRQYGYTGKITKYSETKDSSGSIVISTYHSLFKLEKKFFDQFKVIIGDEVHLFAAKSCTTLMSKTGSIKYKFGTTATLKDTKCHVMALEGMFGKVIKKTTTRELIEKGKLTPAKIICMILKHEPEICKQLANSDASGSAAYQEELNIISQSETRNKFLLNFIPKLKTNTLVLFNLIEHGQLLYNKLIEQNPGRSIYYIDGSVKEREEIRVQMESETDAILVASLQTTSTGVNIKNLHNVVFVHPSKSKIRIMQSIGRILRTLKGKKEVNVFDIADDLTHKRSKNMTLSHFMSRIEIYQEEEYPFVIKTINL